MPVQQNVLDTRPHGVNPYVTVGALGKADSFEGEYCTVHFRHNGVDLALHKTGGYVGVNQDLGDHQLSNFIAIPAQHPSIAEIIDTIMESIRQYVMHHTQGRIPAPVEVRWVCIRTMRVFRSDMVRFAKSPNRVTGVPSDAKMPTPQDFRVAGISDDQIFRTAGRIYDLFLASLHGLRAHQGGLESGVLGKFHILELSEEEKLEFRKSSAIFYRLADRLREDGWYLMLIPNEPGKLVIHQAQY